MQARLQVHLDADRHKALRLLAAVSDASISDLVRRAIDVLLRAEFAHKDWDNEIRTVIQRLQFDQPQAVNATSSAEQQPKRRRKRVAT